jgi:hypothetical protein
MFPGVSRTVEQIPSRGLGGVTSITYDPPTKKAYGRRIWGPSFTATQASVLEVDESSSQKVFNTYSKVKNGNSSIEIGSHGLSNGQAVVYKKDAAAATLKNAAGEAVLTDGKVYYLNGTAIDANHVTLHPTKDDAIANTNKILIQADAASGANSYVSLGAIITQTDHGYQTGNPIIWDRVASGTQITTASGQKDDLHTFYVIRHSANKFWLAATQADALNGIVDVITNDGHDTQKFHPTYGITS